MAVKSLYFKNVTVNGMLSLQDGGTAPTGALTTTGWTVAKLASPNFSLMAVGTKKASGTFATTDALTTATFTAASCWRSEQPFVGKFANTNWTLAFRIRCSLASAQTGAVKVRIWHGPNADGTGAIQLTTGILTGTTTAVLSTTVSATSTVTWTPGSILDFANEYLFVQCEWSVVVASGSNSGDAVFYVESAGVITTSDFTLTIDGDLVLPQAAQTISSAGKVLVDGDLIDTQDDQTVAAAGGPIVSGALTGGKIDTLSATGGPVVGGTLNRNAAPDTLSAAGTITDTGISGALAIPQAPQALAATGTILITGTLARPQAAHTLASVGGPVVSGTLTAPQAAQTLVAAGGPIARGTLALPQANQTLVATGSIPNYLTAVDAVMVAPVFTQPALIINTLLRIGDWVMDRGLTALDTDADKIFLCNSMPSTYLEATSTFALGSKNFGVGQVFAAPAAGTPKGRVISSNSVTGGTVSVAGVPQCWAVVDSINSRLLAAGPANGFTAVSLAWTWTLGQIPIHMDG